MDGWKYLSVREKRYVIARIGIALFYAALVVALVAAGIYVTINHG